MARQIIDTTTPQPGGKFGEPIPTAFEKANANFTELYGATIDALGSATPPSNPIAFMPWIDTSVSPAMLRRRNGANDAWVEIGPALQVLGTASALDVPSGQTAFGTASAASEQALATDHYGATAPTVTWPGMRWADSSVSGAISVMRRNSENTNWIVELTIKADGGVRAGTVPAFSAYSGGTSQAIPNGVETRVNLYMTRFNHGGEFSNHRFTPTIAGVYLISAGILISNPGVYVGRLRKNGIEDTDVAAGLDGRCRTSALISMNGSGDYLELNAINYGDGAAIEPSQSDTFFQGVLVRPA